MEGRAKQAYEIQKKLDPLFSLSPELFHSLAIQGSKRCEHSTIIKGYIAKTFYRDDPKQVLPFDLGGIHHKNPVGLAAGMVKNGEGLGFREQFGFGYIVIGSITGQAQSGNKGKTLVRFSDKLSIRNHKGLNNLGVDTVVNSLAKRKAKGLKPNIPLRASIANSKETAQELRENELLFMIEKLFPYIDVFELNISCPNQQGVCDLQSNGQQLNKLLGTIQDKNKELAYISKKEKKPIIVKISPITDYEGQPEKIKDITLSQLKDIVDICKQQQIEGITAVNTTKEMPKWMEISGRKGGGSGSVLFPKMIQTNQEIKRMLIGSEIKQIGCGGIGMGTTREEIGKSALDTLETGVSAIQLISSFVMGGGICTPYIINEAILKKKNNRP